MSRSTTKLSHKQSYSYCTIIAMINLYCWTDDNGFGAVADGDGGSHSSLGAVLSALQLCCKGFCRRLAGFKTGLSSPSLINRWRTSLELTLSMPVSWKNILLSFHSSGLSSFRPRFLLPFFPLFLLPS